MSDDIQVISAVNPLVQENQGLKAELAQEHKKYKELFLENTEQAESLRLALDTIDDFSEEELGESLDKHVTSMVVAEVGLAIDSMLSFFPVPINPDSKKAKHANSLRFLKSIIDKHS